MLIQQIAFYAFSFMAISAAAMVVFSRNPVFSVLFLILTFFSAAGLFILLGAEFLAMMLIVVYVGAVAVLFLFVVMMLDINFTELRQGLVRYLPIGALIGLLLVAEVILALVTRHAAETALPAAPMPAVAQLSNTHALGQILYTQYFYLFQAAGLILLLAMVGAIVLTHRSRPGVRRQDISHQIARQAKDTIEIKKVPTGSGV